MNILPQIYTELLYRSLVKNQSDLAKKLGYGNSWISTSMNSTEPITSEFQQKLHDVFGISREYLSSNGAQGTMFPPSYSSSQENKNHNVNEPFTDYIPSNKDNKNNPGNENNNSQFIPSSFTKYYDEMISSELLKIIHKRDEQMDELIGVIKSLARRDDNDAQSPKRKAG